MESAVRGGTSAPVCSTRLFTADMPESTPAPDRRNFVAKAASIIVGGLISVVAPVAGLFTLFDPLRRKTDARGLVRVASLASLETNGQPRKFPVLDTLVDAWNKTENVPVGSVYLQRTGDATVRVLNSVCPHLGCSVGYNASTRGYFCPCHRSSFTLDGAIADPKSPSPRGMDELEAVVRDGEVWVRFQNFRKGSPDKIAV
ncbi:Rieske (2Fe-2S) protein [Gemmatimonas sp.]|uniref:QcrA and Rieske domain-containing protein n=1 Tax=Gemmatimonas sp. TaxID=1962908 RepID=UPI00286D70E8|nr:Rieske (2Fe-2S) protein [Gemmatimonas sp.]